MKRLDRLRHIAAFKTVCFYCVAQVSIVLLQVMRAC